MASAIGSLGIRLIGADIALKSDIPIGSGLASSAALEISVGKALVSIAGSQLDDMALALAGQTAEHNHVGTKCGIMDQFVTVYAKRDHAVLLDCRSLRAELVPLNLDPYRLVICDSRVRHSLASSEYNQRRLDCERSAQRLKTVLTQVQGLRDLSLALFEAHKSILPDPFMRRSRHVISENDRTLKAAAALSAGRLTEMGRLMFESHASLRDDYQVSCSELDWLVESAQAQPGVLGARMTGGGFGGCTINLVAQTQIESFKEKVSREYRAKTGILPHIFVAHASEGAGEINY
jgi:galactokinase